MLRSWLFCPGNEERKILKALDLNADAIILDLEDAVALNRKMEARQTIKNVLSKTSKSKNIFVRINSLDNFESFLDIYEMITDNLKGIMLPKAENDSQVKILSWAIDCLENCRNMELGFIEVIPLIETALGVLNVFNIASAGSRVKRLAFGAMDYTLDIGVEYSGTGQELFFARNQIVLASRVAKLEKPIDTVFPDIKDVDGLKKEILEVKQLGFGGKLLIHPAQIDLTNINFSPTEKEIKWAKKVVQAFKEAEQRGIAAIQVEGSFIDPPVVERAKRTLDI